jgi:hypothetical protein
MTRIGNKNQKWSGTLKVWTRNYKMDLCKITDFVGQVETLLQILMHPSR